MNVLSPPSADTYSINLSHTSSEQQVATAFQYRLGSDKNVDNNDVAVVCWKGRETVWCLKQTDSRDADTSGELQSS